MIARVLVLCLLWLWPVFATAAELWGEPLVESIDDQDSLPDDNVTALVEDSRGFLWIGTPNGLLRYDGYRFKRYVNDPGDAGSIAGGFIRALLIDPQGRLWVGTDAEGVSIYDPASDRFEHLKATPDVPGALPDNAIRALALDHDGSVWIGTQGGLAHWNAARRELLRFPADGTGRGPADNRILALTVDATNTLWVGNWRGLDRRLSGAAGFEHISLQAALPELPDEPSVRAVIAASDGSLWVGTLDAAVVRLTPRTAQAERVQLPASDGTVVPSNLMLLTGIQTDSHTLWLGGLGGILLCDIQAPRCRQPLLHDPTVPSGLGSSDIRALLKDRAGQIWIGGYSSGLQRVNDGNQALRMLRYRPLDRNGLSDASISAVLAGADGLLYLGTRGRGVDVLDPAQGVIDRIPPRPGARDGLSNGVVTALARDASGPLWIGTDYGLVRLDYPSHQGRQYLRDDGLPSNTIRRLFFDSRHRLWIGTNQGLAVLEPLRAALQILTDIEGRPMGMGVNAITQSQDGRLWVGSARGLYTVAPDADRLQRVDSPGDAGQSLSHVSVLGLLVDHSGTLWVDTVNGLHRMRGWDGRQAQFEFISGQRGIGGQPFGANLLEDSQGRIWTHRFVYDPARHRVHELLRADGADLGTGWFRAYDRDAGGRLYFGGSKGLLRVDPTLFNPWNYAPPVVVTELTVDGRTQPVPADGATLMLAAGAQQFSVEFAALDYSAPQRLRYAFMLEGRDGSWIEADPSRRIASYANLWPGDYRLRVRGSNRAGQWSPHERVLRIHMAAQFWQTPWFQLLLVLAVLAAGWLGARVYARRLRARAATLQQLVDARTRELSLAKNRAEQTLDDLRDAQQQLVASEKMAALGRLVSGVAHEINTPLGIAITASSMIATRGRTLQSQLDGEQLRKSELQQFLVITLEAAGLVESSLGRAVQLVQTFKQVAVESGVDQRHRFDLEECLHSLCRGLSASWEAAGVVWTLDCPRGIAMDSYPGTVGQIILALSNNALAHAFDGRDHGRIDIAVRPVDAAQVVIVFSDDGIGIAAEVLPQVFEPFYTTKRASGGVGLGLHILYNQVTARLGGTVTLDSTPGQGARVTLRLPCVAPE